MGIYYEVKGKYVNSGLKGGFAGIMERHEDSSCIIVMSDSGQDIDISGGRGQIKIGLGLMEDEFLKFLKFAPTQPPLIYSLKRHVTGMGTTGMDARDALVYSGRWAFFLEDKKFFLDGYEGLPPIPELGIINGSSIKQTMEMLFSHFLNVNQQRLIPWFPLELITSLETFGETGEVSLEKIDDIKDFLRKIRERR